MTGYDVERDSLPAVPGPQPHRSDTKKPQPGDERSVAQPPRGEPETFAGPLPDPFDAAFAATARAVADETGVDPWLVGVFMDNERIWASAASFATHFGVITSTLGRSTEDCPTKAEFSRLVTEKYGTIDGLNSAWATSIPSWADFDAGSVDLAGDEDLRREDFTWLLTAFADEYFRVVKAKLERVLPQHLYLGSRFANWSPPPER